MGSEPISLWGNIDATSFKIDASAKHQEKYVAVLASDFLALQRRAEELQREASALRMALGQMRAWSRSVRPGGRVLRTDPDFDAVDALLRAAAPAPTPASGDACPRCGSDERGMVTVTGGCFPHDHDTWHDTPADAGRE